MSIRPLSEIVAEYMEVSEFAGERHERIGDYDVNVEASKLPLMSEDEFEMLCKSLVEHGLRNPIVLGSDNEIVDGRNRYLGCLAMGLQLTGQDFEYIDGDSKIEVITANIPRRNTTPKVRAELWLKLHGMPEDRRKVQESKVETEDETEVVESKPVVKTREDAAKEAGVSDRTLAKAIKAKKAEDEAKESDEEKAARAEKESTRRKRPKKSDAQFDLTKWKPSFDLKVSKLLAKVPQDMRDICHRQMAESLGSRVSMENVVSADLNSESIVECIERIVQDLPKSEHKPSELAIAQRYSGAIKVKDAETAVESIKAILEGLNDTQRKKAEQLLLGTIDVSAMKASEYLPKLPDDHEAALEVAAKEFKVRFDGLLGFEAWDVNGRRAAAKSWKKSIQSRMTKLSNHTGMDVDDSKPLIETKFPEQLDAAEFHEVWDGFIADRKKRKLPIDKAVQDKQLKILSRFDLEQATEIVLTSKEKQWKGIPNFKDIAGDNWCGRPPAHLLEGDVLPAKVGGSRFSAIPTKSADVPDRSKHGKLNTDAVKKRSMEEKAEEMRK